MDKCGRQVILKVNNEAARALFKAYAWSDEKIENVLNKATKKVRKYLLVSDDIFDGDVSEKHQSHSVPNSLGKLISMIL